MKKRWMIVVALMLMFTFATSAFANDQTITVERVAGSNRYATAVALNQAAFETAETVVLVSGENFPDALTAGPFAADLSSPILLTPKITLPDAVKEELIRLNAADVYIIGGTASVSDTVATEVSALDSVKNVRRLAGANRYETAALIKEAREDITRGVITEKITASGVVFPDALTAGPYAHLAYVDLLLNNGQTPVTEGRIIGGATRVPGTAERIQGPSRYETAVEIAKLYQEEADHAIKTVVLASGEDFPDALASAPFAVSEDAVLLLTRTNTLPEAIKAYLIDNAIERVIIVGGENSVSAAVAKEIAALGQDDDEDEDAFYAQSLDAFEKYKSEKDLGPDMFTESAIYDIDQDGVDEFILHVVEQATTLGAPMTPTWEIFKPEDGTIKSYYIFWTFWFNLQ